MRVERRPMWSTVPEISPIFRKSPTRTAWSKMRDAPAMTFSSVFCAASATAIPPTPSPASAGVGSTPKWRSVTSSATKITSTSMPRRPTRSRDTAAVLDDGSRRRTCASTSPLRSTSSQAAEMMVRRMAVLVRNSRKSRDKGSAGQEKPADDRQEQQTRWRGQGVPSAVVRHPEQAPPRQTDKGRQETVEEGGRQVQHGQPDQHGQQVEEADAGDSLVEEHSRQPRFGPARRELLVELGNGVERPAREQPDRARFLALDAFDDDLHASRVPSDRPDDFLVGRQGVGAGSLGGIAQLGESSR